MEIKLVNEESDEEVVMTDLQPDKPSHMDAENCVSEDTQCDVRKDDQNDNVRFGRNQGDCTDTYEHNTRRTN